MVLPTGSVIRKEPLGPDARRRLRHETEILERLAGLDGVAQLAPDPPPCPGSILLVDVGGTALSRRATPLDPTDLVDLSLSLARAVAGMHHRGVVHRDVNPANIVVSAVDDAPYLVDFTLATAVAAVQQGFTHHNAAVGTVPYLAPEQTGRTGRPVDQRADLYAVGATLYELATGAPPFGSGDPLRIIHDHLARVPAPPSAVNPAVPAGLSEIIMHLLEKEPDDRYQSADGLVHDLLRARRGDAVCPAEEDSSARPLAPSRLVGRDHEIDALDEAFADAMAGHCTGVLVGGAPGIGKTSLVDALRPIVAGRDGWFAAGKFDQYRRDLEYDGVRQSLRALARLLLAEPEDSLAVVLERMLRGLGSNVRLATALVPELTAVLNVSPEPGDPLTAQARAHRTGFAVLRAIATPKRPVVLFVDDLQWAGRTPLGFVDLVLRGEEPCEGLLLVATYRDADVDAAHPLAPLLARWDRQQPVRPRHLRLRGLPPAGQAAMAADLLRLAPEPASELARLIEPSTGGNPYDAVELVNSLRHDGLLTSSGDGWHWDPAALRDRLEHVDVIELLTAHVATLPPAAKEMLTVTACLAGRVELGLLEAATGLPEDEIERRLAPAFADGLMVFEPDDRWPVRFRHDRVRESVLSGLTASARRAARLRLARRLADRPEFFAVAAEQYLSVADAVHAPAERRLMARLFRRAAQDAKVPGNYLQAERFLTAAVALVDPADTDQLIAVRTERHAALYGLGRLEEADEEYRTICQLCTRPTQGTPATVQQVTSLTNLNRGEEAVRLGVDHLRRLGVPVPERDDLEAEIDRGLDAAYRWMDETSATDDLRRPGLSESWQIWAVRLVNRLMPAAFFCDQRMMAWLSVRALDMWIDYGPDPDLFDPVSHIAFVAIRRRQDYHSGYRMMLRILAAGRARGYEPDISEARFLYLVSTGHWFDTLESNVRDGRGALEGLIQGGSLHNACWCHYVLMYGLLDSAPSLDTFIAETDEALALAARTGNGHAEGTFRSFRQLGRVLRGEAIESAGEEAVQQNLVATNPFAVAHLHLTRALAAAILDRPAELAQQAAAVLPFRLVIEATYVSATARVLLAMALAGQARVAGGEDRAGKLKELDELVEWVAERAADAPVNFRHLLRLVEAERAWARGDFHEAAYTFDLAQQECSTRIRPWHRALILERAARFYLANGMEEAGHALLASARRQYQDWGAAAKVSQLDWAYPTLRAEPARVPPTMAPPVVPAGRRSTVMAGTVDLLGIVAASRTLSSETSIEGLRTRVVGILSEMTGATGVHLLLRNQEGHDWLVSTGTGAVPLREADRQRLLPASVIWYAERTHEPVVVADATRDDRFRRDAYITDLDRCSLLVVPILTRGELRAMLLLENRMIRGAFSTERLEGIMLIAGQLAVSLDNALVYASLERKVTERTQQLAAANRRLEQLSITDPLTGLANRRRLEEVLESEWGRAQQQAASIALAMVDIDHFKLYNDHFGHTAGDRCLQRVAACLAQNISDAHLAARYGGEEFAIVMPGTDTDAATGLARHLCSAVKELAEPHPLVGEGVVTASIGVAAVAPTSEKAADEIIELADGALYRAKHGGRGRVKVALPHPAPFTGRGTR
ncbi:serine/threonine protein kinase [Pseudofrankia asymbiotica]|uniref:Serine/threonine protein kinase n=1 Tax=Pseudofrankia asymbiotica TaxID=1834516 RepID=A0A1V2I347_9ACTN|nr:serine/threonine protein kinase [Pseudofrankia asymbiotica]